MLDNRMLLSCYTSVEDRARKLDAMERKEIKYC